jgi:hypothetical protein
MTWRDEARCSESYDRRFFSVDPETIRQVVEDYCNFCPVYDECGEHAEPIGVWGGRSRHHDPANRKHARMVFGGTFR